MEVGYNSEAISEGTNLIQVVPIARQLGISLKQLIAREPGFAPTSRC